MKILIINPNSDENTNEIIRKKAERLRFPGVETDVKSLSYMPKLIASYEDAVLAAPGMIELVKGDENYDGYVVGCHLDPNLEVLREITDKPVIGICEASLRMASMLCSRFAMISPSRSSQFRKMKMIHRHYCAEQYCGTVVPEDSGKEAVTEAAGEAAALWPVDGIVLGCANYALWDRSIEKKYHVRCFDGIACALMLAAGLAVCGRQKE